MNNAYFDIFNRNISTGLGCRETVYVSRPVIQNDDSNDVKLVVEAVETEPIDNANENFDILNDPYSKMKAKYNEHFNTLLDYNMSKDSVKNFQMSCCG